MSNLSFLSVSDYMAAEMFGDLPNALLARVIEDWKGGDNPMAFFEHVANTWLKELTDYDNPATIEVVGNPAAFTCHYLAEEANLYIGGKFAELFGRPLLYDEQDMAKVAWKESRKEYSATAEVPVDALLAAREMCRFPGVTRVEFDTRRREIRAAVTSFDYSAYLCVLYRGTPVSVKGDTEVFPFVRMRKEDIKAALDTPWRVCRVSMVRTGNDLDSTIEGKLWRSYHYDRELTGRAPLSFVFEGKPERYIWHLDTVDAPKRATKKVFRDLLGMEMPRGFVTWYNATHDWKIGNLREIERLAAPGFTLSLGYCEFFAMFDDSVGKVCLTTRLA